MENKSEKPSSFTRALIIIFSLFLAIMAGFSFVKSTPPFSLGAGLITLIAIITLVILSESFNNLSVGQLLTLSRKIKDSKDENEKLSRENERLSAQVIQMAQLVSNIKTNAEASGTSNVHVTVSQATEKEKRQDQYEDIKANLSDEKISKKETSKDNLENTRTISTINREIRRRIEDNVLDSYIKNHGLPMNAFQKDVTFREAFEKIDPVMERVVVFDGYLVTGTKERFFDIKFEGVKSSMYWDRLYSMLIKIYFYRQVKSVQADLTLINIELPEEYNSPFVASPDRFISAFQPAIANNLLKVENVKLSKEEYEDIRRKVEKEITQTENKRDSRTK